MRRCCSLLQLGGTLSYPGARRGFPKTKENCNLRLLGRGACAALPFWSKLTNNKNFSTAPTTASHSHLSRHHRRSADFEQVVRALERLCVDAARAVDRAPGAAFLVQPQGVQPSPATCLESVEDVW